MIPLPRVSSAFSVEFSLHADEIFTPHDLGRIVDGINAEDMRQVDVPSLLSSYAVLGAFAPDQQRGRQAVGFARQVERTTLVTEGAGRLCVGEIGSVWVDPRYRGQKIGSTLIREMTMLMHTVNFIPLAVCNQDSRRTFEAVGFTPIGTMPSTADGNERVVEMYEDHHVDWYVREQWPLGLRDEVLDGIQALPRFQDLNLGSVAA